MDLTRIATSLSRGDASAALRMRLLKTCDNWPGNPLMITEDCLLQTKWTRRIAADLPSMATISAKSSPTSIGTATSESRWNASDCFVIRDIRPSSLSARDKRSRVDSSDEEDSARYMR